MNCIPGGKLIFRKKKLLSVSGQFCTVNQMVEHVPRTLPITRRRITHDPFKEERASTFRVSVCLTWTNRMAHLTPAMIDLPSVLIAIGLIVRKGARRAFYFSGRVTEMLVDQCRRTDNDGSVANTTWAGHRAIAYSDKDLSIIARSCHGEVPLCTLVLYDPQTVQ